MFSLIQKALKQEKGVLDLASIITGTIITGILGAVTAATFIFVIPWFQDKTAKDDINLVKVAEDSQYSDTSSYSNLSVLKASNYLRQTISSAACVALSTPTNASDYTIYVTSKSNTIFRYNRADANPTVVTSIPATPACS